MPIRIRHLKNQRRGTELTYATIPIDELKRVTDLEIEQALTPYFPKIKHYEYIGNDLRSFASSKFKEGAREYLSLDVGTVSKEKCGLIMKKGKNKITIIPSTVLHDIVYPSIFKNDLAHFDSLKGILQNGFVASNNYFTGYDNAYPKMNKKERFTGWGKPSEKEDITKGDIYSLELFPDEGQKADMGMYSLSRAAKEKILSVNIKLDPKSSEEEQEKKMKFYKQEITEAYGLPIRYFIVAPTETVRTQSTRHIFDMANQVRRIFPKKQVLEQKVSAVVAIAGLISSFFFFNASVTGNAIGNIGKSSSSWIGIGLLLLGVVGALFYLYSKKR